MTRCGATTRRDRKCTHTVGPNATRCAAGHRVFTSGPTATAPAAAHAGDVPVDPDAPFAAGKAVTMHDADGTEHTLRRRGRKRVTCTCGIDHRTSRADKRSAANVASGHVREVHATHERAAGAHLMADIAETPAGRHLIVRANRTATVRHNLDVHDTDDWNYYQTLRAGTAANADVVALHHLGRLPTDAERDGMVDHAERLPDTTPWIRYGHEDGLEAARKFATVRNADKIRALLTDPPPPASDHFRDRAAAGTSHHARIEAAYTLAAGRPGTPPAEREFVAAVVGTNERTRGAADA